MKERCSKKRIHVIDNTKETSTLDDIHISNIQKFNELNMITNNLHDELTKLKKEQVDIKNEINKIEDKMSDEVRELWKKHTENKDNIIRIEEEISKNNEKNDVQYYEKIGKVLFDYYDTVDTKVSNTTNSSKFTILNALNGKKPTEQTNKDAQSVGKKTKLVNEYLASTNNKYVNHKDGEFIDDICKNCMKGKMINLQFEAISICCECGKQDILLAEQNRPIMVHDKKDNSHYSYKRINHFREWCNQVQGKESTDIPDEVFEKILNELKKEKIKDTKSITPKQMRGILKKIRTHKYYEHAPYIINRINGIPPPQFSPELEQTLANMFMQTQPLFIKYAPANRLNFISYSYILHKFFLCLEMKEYAKLFPLLKSRTKTAAMEEIFKKICAELGWKFYPSL